MKYNTISQMFYNTVSNNLDKELYYYKNSSEWVPLTGKDILNTVSSIAIALKYRGINTQDKVSILSTTTYRWALCDYGIITMGVLQQLYIQHCFQNKSVILLMILIVN